MKRIIIADDHSIVRDGFEIMLSPIYGSENLTAVKNGKELLVELDKQSFELLILDVQLPDLTAFSLIPLVFERNKQQKILVFSMYPEKTMAKAMLDLGAKGYLNKVSESQTILNAVETILQGNTFLSDTMLQYFTNKYLKNQTEENPLELLSLREMEVLMLLLQGNGVLEIANLLNLSNSTVATYKGRIFEKMGVQNIIDLHNKCLSLGLV